VAEKVRQITDECSERSKSCSKNKGIFVAIVGVERYFVRSGSEGKGVARTVGMEKNQMASDDSGDDEG
jgi:hypothetical protein